VAVPPEFFDIQTGAVLCAAAGNEGHVHGACHSIPFRIVLLGRYKHGDEAGARASVYSSETGIWSDFISAALPDWRIYFCGPGTLVGNSLYWVLMRSRTTILELDLDRQSLAVIERPRSRDHSAKIIRAEDGGVGLAILSCPGDKLLLQMWDRKVDSYGSARWVLRKTVELQETLGLRFMVDGFMTAIVRYAEDVHAIIVAVHGHVFMVHLDSMQTRELHDHVHSYYHFTSFYTEGLKVIYYRNPFIFHLLYF
jgi:hypothetical protein